MKKSKQFKYDVGIVDSKKYNVGEWFVAIGVLAAISGLNLIRDSISIKTYPEFLSGCEKEMKKRGILKKTGTNEDVG